MTTNTRHQGAALRPERSAHLGEWVAIKDNQVVAAAATPAELFADIDRRGLRNVAVDHIFGDPDTVQIL